MATTKEDVSLVLKAAGLARSSPREWSEFLEEARKYTDRVKDKCVMSAPGDLPHMQGRARESAVFLAVLAGCVQEADKLAASMTK